jgi:hypothetical protein
MLKVIAAATLLASASTIAAIPASDPSDTSTRVAKTDRLSTGNDTGIRNYLSPRLNGNRIAFCLTGESRCGKEAADGFCRDNGFEEAITFQRDKVQSNSARLRFRQIKCWHPQLSSNAQQQFTGNPAAMTSNAVAKSNRL